MPAPWLALMTNPTDLCSPLSSSSLLEPGAGRAGLVQLQEEPTQAGLANEGGLMYEAL
jgi:hypothetical protein